MLEILETRWEKRCFVAIAQDDRGIDPDLRLYSDRICAAVGGLAKALRINLWNRHMAAIGEQPHEPIDRRRLTVSTTASLLVLVLCLFLPAGTWAWSRGWLFLVVTVGASVVSGLYLRRVNPD